MYYKERLWVGDVENGYVGITTLWSPKDMMVDLISNKIKSKVAVVGQLYTKRGIEYIFRNVWLNPKIRYLIVTGTDFTQSGEFLIKKDLVEIKAILETVPEKDIKKFFESVEIIDMRGRGGDEVMKKVEDLEYKKPFAKISKSFEEVKPNNQVLPSENSGFRVEAETIGEGWLQILGLITKFGRKIPRIHVYGGFERTLLNVVAVITDENIKEPKIWPFLDFKKDDLKNYFKNFFTPERGEEAYTYGERLFSYEIDGKVVNQIDEMTKKMKSFPYNKGALAILWQAGIDNFPIRKPWRTPCLTLIQGFCMDESFYLTAYFRSNDMYAAWPQNAFALRKLQTEIANKISKKVGDLTVISSCAFIDEGDVVKSEKLVKDNQKLFCRFDPRGNFIIETEGEDIVVKQMTSDNKFLKEYRQNGKEDRAALKLVIKLLEDMAISRVDHAIDVGQQLARAEDAIKLNLKFVQDKELG